MNENELLKIAARIAEIIDPWDLDYSSPAEIAEEIKKDPAAAINYLLDTIEELRG